MNFVVSYPKSGNTWIRLVTATYNAGDVEMEELMSPGGIDGKVSNVHFIDSARYHYQSVSSLPVEKIDFPMQVRLRPAAMIELEREVSLSRAGEPTVVKSHHFHGEINDIPLWHTEWTDRVVNPVRDPREICCSYADHMDASYEDTAEHMNGVRARMEGDNMGQVTHFLSTWSNHVRGWLNADEIPVHTVRYEDMQADPVGEFYDILDFLEAPDLSEQRVEEVVEKTRFERVREAEEEHGFSESPEHQDRFFRSGKTDGWKEELPLKVVRKIEKDHGEIMAELGYL